jgi:hypothetical protein
MPNPITVHYIRSLQCDSAYASVHYPSLTFRKPQGMTSWLQRVTQMEHCANKGTHAVTILRGKGDNDKCAMTTLFGEKRANGHPD